MQHKNDMQDMRSGSIPAFIRNRYFYGKLLDVYHFESEQNYLNQKRWLLNRWVTGYGVLCGLNVELAPGYKSVVVKPGLAIDRAGREIVVPSPSEAVTIPNADPQKQANDPCYEGEYSTLVICYHECDTDPEPVAAGDCGSPASCSPGIVRERYQLAFVPGKAPKIDLKCDLQDLVLNGRVNYEALANHVTKSCKRAAFDPCIPLANVRLPMPDGKASPGDIDITIRPIVFTNDLLFDLLLCLTHDQEGRPHGGKY